jgi:hypothetical protein
MSGTAFTAALFVGTAVVAAWFVVRYPAAAPQSLLFRGAAVFGTTFAARQIRVDASDALHLYATVFGFAFPILAASWIAVFWLMQTLREAVPR